VFPATALRHGIRLLSQAHPRGNVTSLEFSGYDLIAETGWFGF